MPTATANRANCQTFNGPIGVGDLTPRGSYTGSPSSYGTFDQAGNVKEWDEGTAAGPVRRVRGGSFFSYESNNASWAYTVVPVYPEAWESSDIGFRLALIPEPSTGLLVAVGFIGIAVRRRLLA